MSHDSYTKTIRWTTRRPGKSGDRGQGTLAGVEFEAHISSNGGPSSASWKVYVWADGHMQKRTGHVGGMRAAQSALSMTVRDAVARVRGDVEPTGN